MWRKTQQKYAPAPSRRNFLPFLAKNEADVCSTPPKWRKTEQVHAETLSKKGNSIHLVGFSPKSSLFFVEKIPGARSPQTKADVQQNKAAALEQRNRIRKPRPQAQREGERRQTNDRLNAKRSAWQDFRRKREDSSDGGFWGFRAIAPSSRTR